MGPMNIDKLFLTDTLAEPWQIGPAQSAVRCFNILLILNSTSIELLRATQWLFPRTDIYVNIVGVSFCASTHLTAT